MWQIDNQTPFEVGGIFTRNQTGQECWLVTTKVTYTLGEGVLLVDDNQAPLNYHCCYCTNSDDLLYESDFELYKKNTDIILNANAYSPNEKPVTEMEVELLVGNKIKKTLRVIGNRYWEKGFFYVATDPEPFTIMPLTYCNAFGGKSGLNPDNQLPYQYSANPVGKGFHTADVLPDGLALPNVEYYDSRVKSTLSLPKPAGFGVIAGHYDERSQYEGSYDENWRNNRYPLRPEDFSPKYFQHVPADQQYHGYVRGGEEITLKGMHPMGDKTWILPKLHLQYLTYFKGSKARLRRPRCYSVILEPDANRLIMVYQDTLECQGKEELLLKTIVTKK